MAEKDLTPIKGNYNEITNFNFEAATSAADGMKFILPAKDEEVVIFVNNTDSASNYKVTVKAPQNGGYAAAMSDLVATVEKSGYAVIRLESAKYANNDGTVCIVPENIAVKAVVLY